MYYVYFLKSLRNNDLYIGSTENVFNRLKKHNLGEVKSTQFIGRGNCWVLKNLKRGAKPLGEKDF